MNFVYVALLAVAWVAIECMVGGTRLLFSLPCYALISICSLLTLASFGRKKTPPDPWCLGATLLLGVWILARGIYSPVEYLALPDFLMMTACLMVYLITVYYLTALRDQVILLSVLWAIAAAEVWVGLIQFGKNPAFMLFGFQRPGVNPRASGMYISPNNFAGYLVTVGILAASFGLWSRWRLWAKVLAIYIAIFCFAGVAISGSRGGYFAAIAAFVCFAAGSFYALRAADPRRFMMAATASVAGLALVLGGAAFLMFHSEFLTRRMQTMAVKDVRIYNWQAALDHIRFSPWIGTGSGTHLIYGRLFRRHQIQADPVHAHCDYLELLAEYGAVGGVCMALFLAAHVRNGFLSFSQILRRRIIPSGLNQSNSFAMQLGALCAVAGLAVHSIVDFDMHIPANAMVFAFIFGILANPGLDRQPAGFSDRRVVSWARLLLLPLLAMLMLWKGLPLLPSEYYSEMARRSLRDKSMLEAVQYVKKGLGNAFPYSMPGAPANSSAESPPPQGPVEKARAAVDTLLNLPNPKNPDLYFYLGEANRALGSRMINPYMRRNYFERANAAFVAGLRVFPQDESMMVRYGQSLDGLREFSKAETVYQDALKVDPNLSIIYDYYATHLAAEGKKQEAEAVARKRRAMDEGRVDAEQPGDMRLQ